MNDVIAFIKANLAATIIGVGIAITVAHSRYVPEGWGIIPIAAGVGAFLLARRFIRP
jgi:hypothetical protein